MFLAKKLVFGILFLCSFIAFLLQSLPFLQDPMSILSLDTSIFIAMLLLVSWAMLTSLFFVVFITLAQDIRIISMVSPAIIVSTLLLIPFPLNIFFLVGIIVSFSLMIFLVTNKLQSYLTFHPGALLVPSITQTVTLLLFLASFLYFFAMKDTIQTKGFRLPDSLVESVIQLSPITSVTTEQLGMSGTESLSAEQIAAIRQNPQLLSQFGLDPSVLDTLETSGTAQTLTANDLLKATIESQIQTMVQPFLAFIPILFTFLFFLTITSFASLLSLLLYPIIWFVFWFLQQIHATSYTTEMREVKKLVVS